MSPLGPLHMAPVNRLNRLLVQMLGDDAIVSVQNAAQLDDYSGPRPDIAVLRPRDDYCVQALPRSEDIFLLIEVADTSIEYDRDMKLPRYAASNVPEVWIVDADHRLIEQNTRPIHAQYTQISKALHPGRVQSAALPQILIAADQVFIS